MAIPIRQEVINTLVRLLADRKLDSSQVLPSLKLLADDMLPAASLADLNRLLFQTDDPALDPIRSIIRTSLVSAAIRFRSLKMKSLPIPESLRQELGDLPLDAPVGWLTREQSIDELGRALSHLSDLRCLADLKPPAPAITQAIEEAFMAAAKACAGVSSLWGAVRPGLLLMQISMRSGLTEQDHATLQRLREAMEAREQAQRKRADALLSTSGKELPDDLEQRVFLDALADRAAAAESFEERRRLLDIAACWPTDQVALVLPRMCPSVWAQDRVSLILSLRFGEPHVTDWPKWDRYLANHNRVLEDRLRSFDNPMDKRPEDLLLIWCAGHDLLDPETTGLLDKLGRSACVPVDSEDLAARWHEVLGPEEADLLVSHPPPPLPPRSAPQPSSKPPPLPVLKKELPRPPAAVPREVPKPPVAVSQPAPADAGPQFKPEPAWKPKFRAFLLENWYLVVGLIMMLVGCSVLVYYTWDKYWVLRNTLMPGLLAGITLALAFLGSKLEKIEDALRGTAATLRAAAIALLPVNLMLATRLLDDPGLPVHGFVAWVVICVYIVLIGRGLNTWSAAVHPPFGRWLGIPLLIMNLLVLLRPAIALSGMAGPSAHRILESGFYLGFLFAAFPVMLFSIRKDITATVIADRRIPWFLGGTLILTFVEILSWVYGSLRLLPDPVSYSPMVVLTAGLFLYAESRMQRIEGAPGVFGRESFVGFALLFAGMMMSVSHPIMRVAVLWLTAAVWLAHAWRKAHPAGDTLGVVLLFAACVSIAFLPRYPAPLLPFIGIMAAALLEVFVRAGRRLARPGFDRTASNLQVTGLAGAVMAAVWRRWILHVDPALGAACLVAVAASFLYLALRDNLPRWVHGSVVLLALAIAAFDRCCTTTSIPMGLALASWLWMANAPRLRSPVAAATRSTVTILCAALTTAVLLFHVVDNVVDARVLGAGLYLLTLAGPLLLVAALISAAPRCRSPLPAYLAAVIVILLCLMPLPPSLGLLSPVRPGSGLISSVLALAAVLACFRIRQIGIPPLAGPEDPFFGGGAFPFRREDHGLFTGPLMLVSFFLLARIAVWVYPANVLIHDYTWQAGIGFALTAVTWTSLGVFSREVPRRAIVFIHLGWVSLLVALLVHDLQESADPDWSRPVLITMIILQMLYFLYARIGRGTPWVRDLLANTMARVLGAGSLVATVLCLGCLSSGISSTPLAFLMMFLAAQHVWHGVAAGRTLHGVAIFLLGWINALAWAAPGHAPLLGRLSLDSAAAATLFAILAAHAAGLLLERTPWKLPARPVVFPSLVFACILSVCLGVVNLLQVAGPFDLSRPLQVSLFAGLLLSARSMHFGPALLLAAMSAHLFAFADLPPSEVFSARNLSVTALLMALFAALGCRLYARAPDVFTGGYASTRARAAAPWLYRPGIFLARISVLAAILPLPFVVASAETWVPFVGAATLIFAALEWRVGGCLTSGVMALLLGNIHATHVLAGPWLTQHGLTWIHITNIGLLIGLAECTAARMLLKGEVAAAYLNRVSLAVAGSMLALIVCVYAAQPDLRALTSVRLAVSGALAYAAALSFRWVARRRPAGLQADWIESVYHFGVTLALWCAALTIPALRTPGTALWALAIPLFYFYLRAELGAPDSPRRKAYLVSASTMGFLVLALYAFRFAFQLVLFPTEAVPAAYYHRHAALLIVIAPILFRLRGLGGTSWLVFYGGIAMIAGTYFAWTQWPGLSPFTYPVAGAWCALASAHFWILVSYQRSPIRTVILRLSALDVREWYSHRHAWGVFLLAAIHAALIWAAFDGSFVHRTTPVAPLVLAAASVFMHMAVIRRSRTYYALGWIEIALALHMDFFMPSFLPARSVVWAILGVWALCLAAQAVLRAWFRAEHMNLLARYFSLFCLGHVLYLGPASDPGLWAFAATGLLAALTPVRTRDVQTSLQDLPASVLPWVPAWLVFFSQLTWSYDGAFLTPALWAVLTTTLAILLTGFAAALAARKPELAARFSATHAQPLLLDRTLAWLSARGDAVWLFTLGMTLVVVTPAWLFARALGFALRNDLLLAALCAMSAAAWFVRSWIHKSVPVAVLGQLCVLGTVAALRAAAILRVPGAWEINYDLGISLGVSAAFTAARQILQGRHRELERAFTGALVVLPAVILAWAVQSGWGFDPAILVVSVHTLFWIWAGKDDRHSPFNALAVGGFVAVLMMIFWAHLSFRTLHAYVLPPGIGVLVLLHLFRDRIDPTTRNVVRGVAMVAMMASVGYEILTASSHTFSFHITFLLLSLLAMGLGGWLNVRIYLLLGFSGVLLDLASIAYQTFMRMDRSLQMTFTGLAVLLLGAAFVFGAVYVKTHRAAIGDKADAWRKRFEEWE